MIKGLHHVSFKCSSDKELKRVMKFYTGVLELKVCLEWSNGFMIETPSGKIEFFTDGTQSLGKGVIRHFAFEVDDVDYYSLKCKNAGYNVFIEPKILTLGSVKAKVAFCIGPLGEDIEFFEEYR